MTDWPGYGDDFTPHHKADTAFEALVGSVRDVRKAQAEGEIAADKADQDAGIAKGKATADAHLAWATSNRSADIENLDKFHTAMYGLATGAVARGQGGAELVQKGSAALVAIYSGLLALVFSVTDNPLPLRGVLSPIFLGLAVVLSTAYVAYIGPTDDVSPGPTPTLGLEPKSFARLNAFTYVTNKIATRRSWALRASVVALGFGLAFIAVPFISFTGADTVAPLAAVDAPSWPTPSPAATSAPEVEVFKAQVSEVAALRAKAPKPVAPANDGLVLVVGLLVGIACVVVLPIVLRD
jgi:hypothetical protein